MNIFENTKKDPTPRIAPDSYAHFKERREKELKSVRGVNLEKEILNIYHNDLSTEQALIKNMPSTIRVLSAFSIPEEQDLFRTYELMFELGKRHNPDFKSYPETPLPLETFYLSQPFDNLFMKSVFANAERLGIRPLSTFSAIKEAKQHLHDFLLSSKGFCYMNYTPTSTGIIRNYYDSADNMNPLFSTLKDSEVKSISDFFSYFHKKQCNGLWNVKYDDKTIELLNNVIKDCELDNFEASNLAASIVSFQSDCNMLLRCFQSIDNTSKILNFDKEIFDKALSYVLIQPKNRDIIEQYCRIDRIVSRQDGGTTRYKPQELINTFLDKGLPECAQSIVEGLSTEAWYETHSSAHLSFTPRGIHIPNKEKFEDFFTKKKGSALTYYEEEKKGTDIYSELKRLTKEEKNPYEASKFLDENFFDINNAFFELMLVKPSSRIGIIANPEMYGVLLQKFPGLTKAFIKKAANAVDTLANTKWLNDFGQAYIEAGGGYQEYQKIMEELTD